MNSNLRLRYICHGPGSNTDRLIGDDEAWIAHRDGNLVDELGTYVFDSRLV